MYKCTIYKCTVTITWTWSEMKGELLYAGISFHAEYPQSGTTYLMKSSNQIPLTVSKPSMTTGSSYKDPEVLNDSCDTNVADSDNSTAFPIILLPEVLGNNLQVTSK